MNNTDGTKVAQPSTVAPAPVEPSRKAIPTRHQSAGIAAYAQTFAERNLTGRSSLSGHPAGPTHSPILPLTTPGTIPIPEVRPKARF
jgi:hypothetical protein